MYLFQETTPKKVVFWFCYTKGMKPLRDLLLISLEKKEDKTESGIFVSKGWNTAQNIAVVDATGPFVESAEPGQRILINPYACIDIPGNETQKFIREKDVMSHV